MKTRLREIAATVAPEALAARLRGVPGLVLLRGGTPPGRHSRYSFLAARPFLTLRAWGSRCELRTGSARRWLFGNPWPVLAGLLARYELLDEPDLPFPLGGCFGYWGYDLKNFLEPRLPRRAARDLALPDCHLGFYDSLVVFDHHLAKTWIVSTGLRPDGTCCPDRLRRQLDFWLARLESASADSPSASAPPPPAPGPWTFGPAARNQEPTTRNQARQTASPRPRANLPGLASNFARAAFLAAVERAQRYIRAGDIYQVNLAQRLSAPWPHSGWALFERLSAVSPAPFAGYLDSGDFQLVSSSPELFLRLSGAHILTRPIKGTRPRGADTAQDARFRDELLASPKERAELVMITDLLRNDLGRVCEFGSVQVPELARWEPFAQVQHLVSTVEGRLRPEVGHLTALAACFPGGSITGAPKIRAMEIIDELEPNARGPYTGALGYLGFNRESQLSIIIRTALCLRGRAWFHVGAGIVADSEPAAEYEETLAKARGFFAALAQPGQGAAGGATAEAAAELAAHSSGWPLAKVGPAPER